MMQFFLKIALIITATCYCVLGYSQSYVYKHYGVEDGLPSSEVYSAFQDSKGYMWFATDAGVSRFNGYEFENFNASDGLTDNTVFLITEDSKGRIWFGTFNLKLSYFENDSIYPYQYNNKIAAIIKEKKAMNSFRVDSLGGVWIGINGTGIFKIDEKGNTAYVHQKTVNVDVAITPENLIYGTTGKELIDNNVLLKIHHNDSSFSVRLEQIRTAKKDNLVVQKLNDAVFYFLSPENAFSIDITPPGKAKKLHGLSFIKNRMASSIFEDNHIWLSVLNQGVYECKIVNDSVQIVNHYLPDKQVSRVFIDNEGGIWFQTLTEGIYYLASNNLKVYAFEGRNISAIEIDTVNNRLFTLLRNGAVYKSNEGLFKKIHQSMEGNYPLKYDYFNERLILGDPYQKDLIYYQKGKIMRRSLSVYDYGAKSFLIDNDTMYKANNYGLSIQVEGVETYFSYTYGEKKMWCTSLMKHNQKIWIGTNHGIEIYYNKKIDTPFSNNKYLSSAITAMERVNEHIFLVGTKSYGIVVMQGDSIVEIINEESGLAGDLVKKIHMDQQNTIWVGTNKGISRINYNGYNNYEVYNISGKQGLVTSEINDICSYQNKIYVATSKGLMEFDQSKLSINKSHAPVYITTFGVNEQEREVLQNYQLSYKENNISISFEALNYRSVGEIEYRYRVLGIETNWISTTSRTIRFSSLPKGDYTFEVKAKNEDGYWSNAETITFTISPPIWLTWWFIALMVLLGVILIYLILTYRIKQLNQKNTLEKRMVELELVALRAQMNPHFIFNTLNTIQNAIYTLDKEVAANYIAHFGRLIRIVLETSKKPKILLHTEIEMLSLYIELEAERFSNKFSFEITKDPVFSDDTYHLPSMVIQPFVENAILHGLVPKKSDDLLLSLDFKLKDSNTMLCTISDNGIGRAASNELNKSKNLNKSSMGMHITKERLDLYQQEKGKQFSVKIIDLKGKEGEAMGTKVEITFTI